MVSSRYFKVVVAALLVLASAIGWFIYTTLNVSPDDLVTEEVGYLDDGMPVVNPGGDSFPTTEPYVPEPDYPPPG